LEVIDQVLEVDGGTEKTDDLKRKEERQEGKE
jgi:hypothetical protein